MAIATANSLCRTQPSTKLRLSVIIHEAYPLISTELDVHRDVGRVAIYPLRWKLVIQYWLVVHRQPPCPCKPLTAEAPSLLWQSLRLHTPTNPSLNCSTQTLRLVLPRAVRLRQRLTDLIISDNLLPVPCPLVHSSIRNQPSRDAQLMNESQQSPGSIRLRL